MLDDRRKEFLRSINIKNIKPNGLLWIWGEEIRTSQLTKEDIRYLRWYHNNPNIAYQVDVSIKNNYQLAKDRDKYSTAHVKGKVKNQGISKVIIVGSLVVSVIVGGLLLPNSFAKDKHLDEHSIYIEAPVDLSSREEQIEVVNIDEAMARETTIKHLCDIYQVDYNTVYRKICELTGNFSSSDYLDGHVDGITCKGDSVYASSEDELLMHIVRNIKQLPGNFGLDESIRIHNGYSSGTDYEKQISDVCEVLGIDRNLMYAIVRSETSFNSELFNQSNNPAGLRGVNGVDEWWKFETKEEGFIEFGMELLKYYRMLGIDPSDVSPETVTKIGNIHAPLSDGNEYWLGNVLEILEYAQNNEAEIFGIKEENHGLGR